MPDQCNEFIEQAFIEPIRSVVIVDDDYPTIEEILKQARASAEGQEPVGRGKEWTRNPESVESVIKEFRSDEKKCILDLHDAQNGAEAEGASHLHGTDLLVLDYQLDPLNADNYELSLGILRRLLANDHFNLVVVNTSHALDEVFENFLLTGYAQATCRGMTENGREPCVQG